MRLDLRQCSDGEADMRLDNCVAAITGGGSGIGAACALAFAHEGANVAIGDLDLEKANSVVEKIEGMGRKAIALGMDVTRQADIDNLVEATEDRLGPLKIWVGCPGITVGASILDQTREDWRRIMNLNLDGVFFSAQAAARRMVRHGQGSIINLSSMYGTRAVHDSVAYCASKAAVIMLTEVMAIELAEYGVRANSIGPGYTDTPLFRGARAKRGESFDPLLQRVPAGRLAQPAEIADAAVFLASDESLFITGHALQVDGGWSANGSWKSAAVWESRK